jgi:xanthine dehydrogenase accessory factor
MASGWQPAYVGMIGSKRKVEASLERLREELGDAAPWDALYSPVGLNIGGPTPAEIAVSVAAEMQAVRYGRAGHHHMRLEHSQR